PLLDPPKIAGEPIAALLELLERPEHQTRYTAKIELRERDPAQVKAALDQWLSGLDPKYPRFLHHQVEALWMYRNIGAVNAPLLVALLEAPDPHARAAATQQLRYWHSGVPRAADLLRKRANDASGLVRLEAAIAASWMQSLDAADAALDLLEQPMDNYLTYALRTSLDSMKPLWTKNDAFQAEHPQLAKFITESEPPKKKRAVKKEKPDPFDKLEPQLVRISTLPERMQFTVTEFKVKAGRPVKLILENPDATQHNLLICAPGSADELGLAANEMAKIPGAFDKSDFVPKSDKVLHATKMLKQNESDTLRFHAPAQPGPYPYICSFPGHYLVMRGVMTVE
nr:HEAT repeat domain-containing protein [Verrucomicrobiota bacterium]